jgi:hypothetical protein
MKAAILHTLRYFVQFGYPPTIDELWVYHPQKITRSSIERAVAALIKEHKVIGKRVKTEQRYTVQGYSTILNNYTVRKAYSEYKEASIERYKNTLSVYRSISFIGVSGSVSMKNAKKNDDIDLFIITGRKRLWTGRLIAILLAEVMGKHRRRNMTHTADTICLNLFFDGSALAVPASKRSEYVAHELLQLKPIFSRDHTYERLVWHNKWIFDIFPNSIDMFRYIKKSHLRPQTSDPKLFTWIGDVFEHIFGFLQKMYIRRHQTTELITQKQLWFHPEDYGKKLKIGV